MSLIDASRFAALMNDPVGLAALLDELPVGVALMEPEGRILLVNRTYETVTGLARDRAMGLRCLHALRCDYCQSGCPLMSGWTSTTPGRTEANIITRSREMVYIRLTVAPLTDPEGKVIGVIETVALRGDQAMDEAAGTFGLGELVGRSPMIRKIFAMAPSIALTDSAVLITGETGTGKDMLAQEIHNSSDRNDGPFIKVNCGALPETLLESELFGHVKDAFPGADMAKPGRLRMAHGGTLFLTEIGDLPESLQAKLLAYFDDHMVYPIGSTKGIRTDVRIIASSCHDPEELAQQHRLRQDLLYRLGSVRLHLPPLRERGEDISLLQDHFLKMFQARFAKRLDGFSKNVQTLLGSYAYPGNVREMRNLIEYAVNFCDGNVIRLRHLPGYMLHAPASPDAASPALAAPGPASRPDPAPTQRAQPQRWEDVQRKMILDALVKTGGKKQQAAKLLGWGRSTLWRKMKHFGIE
jgi:PAS domain S-box-containing protein